MGLRRETGAHIHQAHKGGALLGGGDRQVASRDMSRGLLAPNGLLQGTLGRGKEAGFVKGLRGQDGGWEPSGGPGELRKSV